MISKRFYQEVVSDELIETDWQALLSLNLKPLHRSYIELFCENSNKPMEHSEVYELLQAKGFKSRADKILLSRLSDALKRRQVPYRLRAITHDPRLPNRYKVVKVGEAQKRQTQAPDS